MDNGTTFPSFSQPEDRSGSWNGQPRGNDNTGFKKPWTGEKKPWDKDKKPWNGNKGGFQRPVETDMTLYRPYAVAANPDIPEHISQQIVEFAKRLDQMGYTARLGGSDKGIDQMVEDVVAKKELILPWRNFAGKDSKFTFTTDRAKAVAKAFHTVYETMSDVVKLFLARNARMVMGDKMVSPALFILCWSEDGVETQREKTSRTGNIGHLVSIASGAGIQVFNMGRPGSAERLNLYLEERRNEQPATV